MMQLQDMEPILGDEYTLFHACISEYLPRLFPSIGHEQDRKSSLE